MITDIDGVRVGHWTDVVAQTGCTVVTFPDGTVASGEVRGGAPATREFALLDPTRMVTRIDAAVLTGGSAFGLSCADGVMDALGAAGVGFDTIGGVVPIVVAMGLYDLATGDGTVRPGPDQGRHALATATGDTYETGLVGAGTGATVAKWRGMEHRRPGGLVTRTVRGPGGVLVSTLIAVNAFGEPGASHDDVVAVRDDDAFVNTTIGIVVTNAALDKMGCHLVAQSAHDGLARAVAPSHTHVDGDAFVVAATGTVPLDDAVTVAGVRSLAVAAVAGAISTLNA